jgi:hypothetical protein
MYCYLACGLDQESWTPQIRRCWPTHPSRLIVDQRDLPTTHSSTASLYLLVSQDGSRLAPDLMDRIVFSITAVYPYSHNDSLSRAVLAVIKFFVSH